MGGNETCIRDPYSVQGDISLVILNGVKNLNLIKFHVSPQNPEEL
jgi:hypothetical protein